MTGRETRKNPASIAQSVEQGTENPSVGGSIPPWGTTLYADKLRWFRETKRRRESDRFQSGQMDQTVNLTSSTSVVRIHLCPPLRHTRKERIKLRCVCLFLCKTKVKWKITVFADTVFVVSSHIGAVICFLLTWRNESLDGNCKSRWALYKKDSCTINLL